MKTAACVISHWFDITVVSGVSIPLIMINVGSVVVVLEVRNVSPPPKAIIVTVVPVIIVSLIVIGVASETIASPDIANKASVVIVIEIMVNQPLVSSWSFLHKIFLASLYL
jgi:hypothetical protein